jgi:fucose permease
VAGIIMLGLSWKWALLVPLVTLALICWFTKMGGGQTWRTQATATNTSGRLPNAFWCFFAIIFLNVAAEWSIAFWCPEYLEHGLRFPRATAVAGLSVFLFSMLAGRVVGSRLAGRFATGKLLINTTILAVAGFMLFWCGRDPLTAFAGLIMVGLGQSNIYPLALAAAIDTAPDKTTRVTANMAVSSGTAILLAPLLLGIAADRIGIMQAYGIVAVLLLVGLCTAIYSSMMMKRNIAAVSA